MPHAIFFKICEHFLYSKIVHTRLGIPIVMTRLARPPDVYIDSIELMVTFASRFKAEGVRVELEIVACVPQL